MLLHQIPGTLLALALAAGGAAADAPRQLIGNGDFEEGDKAPAGWSGVHTGVDAENRYLHLVAAPDRAVSATTVLPLGAKAAKALELACRYRSSGLSGGAARIGIEFRDGEGRSLLPAPVVEIPMADATWKVLRQRFFVPAGTVAIAVSPVLDKVATGSLDLDDIGFTAVHPVYVAAEERFAGVVASDAGGKPPSELHVDGNRLLDAGGAAVRLQGVAIPGGDSPATADAMVATIALATELWKANAVRIDLDRDAWAGKAKGQADGGTAYRASLDRAVKAASSRGAWALLELRGSGTPGAADAAFWKDAAAHWKDEPAAVFALFAQPGAAAAAWRDAMQPLLDAVRAGGASNLVIAEAGPDLAGIQGRTLAEHGGRGIAYGTVLHPAQRGWQERLLAPAAAVPVIILDLGCPLRAESGGEDPFTWAPDALACVQAGGISWIAGSFGAGGPNALINERLAPTPWIGNFVRAALAGAHFSSERKR